MLNTFFSDPPPRPRKPFRRSLLYLVLAIIAWLVFLVSDVWMVHQHYYGHPILGSLYAFFGTIGVFSLVGRVLLGIWPSPFKAFRLMFSLYRKPRA